VDLVLLPINLYQRDGKVLRALSRGASSFARTLSAELLHITSQLAMQAQTLFETIDRVFAPHEFSPASQRTLGSDVASAASRSRWTRQPRSAREGFNMACKPPQVALSPFPQMNTVERVCLDFSNLSYFRPRPDA
jgi:hypothetical protein